jgi:hypothetical protein
MGTGERLAPKWLVSTSPDRQDSAKQCANGVSPAVGVEEIEVTLAKTLLSRLDLVKRQGLSIRCHAANL